MSKKSEKLILNCDGPLITRIIDGFCEADHPLITPVLSTGNYRRVLLSRTEAELKLDEELSAGANGQWPSTTGY
jgi:hypothetical protein